MFEGHFLKKTSHIVGICEREKVNGARLLASVNLQISPV